MRMQVAVDDTAAAGSLMRLLRERLDADAVSFDLERMAVCVEARSDPRQSMARALATIEAWLAVSGHGPAGVEIDGSSYVLGATAAAGEMSGV